MNLQLRSMFHVYPLGSPGTARISDQLHIIITSYVTNTNSSRATHGSPGVPQRKNSTTQAYTSARILPENRSTYLPT